MDADELAAKAAEIIQAGWRGAWPVADLDSVEVSYVTVDEVVKATMPRCATCKHWERGAGGWGDCGRIDLTHYHDAQIVGAKSRNVKLHTIADFGCTEHSPRPTPEDRMSTTPPSERPPEGEQ
jgi:hypothetical protein